MEESKEKIYQFYALVSEDNKDDIRYVGVTSRTIEERFRQHKYCATHPEKRGLPVHKWMYSVYKKGGKISPIKIDECVESQWEEREKFLIKKYKDLGFRLLNLEEGGKGSITAEKRSISSIERSAIAHRKPIIAYNLDGTFHKRYNSITEATKELNLNSHNNIVNVLKGRSKSASGFIWKYEDEQTENIETYKVDRHSKNIYRFDINGTLIKEYEAIVDILSDFDKISYNGINNAIKTKKFFHDSFWSYENKINIEEYQSPFKYKVYFEGRTYYFKFHKEIREFIKCSQTFLDNHFTKKPEPCFIYNNKYLISKIDHVFTEEEKNKVL